ncbi:BRCA1-associated RING domain protein 1 isoform X2 [Rhinatrema bivittatum]|nr:BRCA1-associated RING domain protein 1 isoform X2 [Rhinatrema bivittatum]
MIQLCSKLQNLLDKNKRTTEKRKSLGKDVALKESPAKEVGNKKKQIRMWFSPRSKRVRYILDKEQKQPQPVVLGRSVVQASSTMYDFLPSPPSEQAPKKAKKSRCKKVKKKNLVDINQEWGVGKKNQKAGSELDMEIEEEKPMEAQVERVVSFCSQPLVLCSPESNTVEKTMLEVRPEIESNLVENGSVCHLKLSMGSKTLPTDDNSEPASATETFDINNYVSEKPNPSEITITPVKCTQQQLGFHNSTLSDSKRQRRGKLHASSDFCVHEDCLGFSPLGLPEKISENTEHGTIVQSLPFHTPLAKASTVAAVKKVDSPTVSKLSKSPCMSLPDTLSRATAGHCSPSSFQVSPSNLSSTKRNHKGETLLHVASIKGDLHSVEELLISGADPNVKDNAGWTPLHEACNLGHEKVVILLLQHMALVNTAGYQNETPLHDAVKNGHVNIVKLLLNHGASQDAVNIFGLRPIDYAENEEMKSILQQPSSGNKRRSVAHPYHIVNFGHHRGGPVVLMGSGLTSGQQRDLNNLALILKAGRCIEFNNSVTHLIVPNKPILNTMKCMLGILAGCWILNFQWVKSCLAIRDREQELEYEIPDGPQRGRLNREQLLPKLLDGCHFYFLGNFISHKKGDLTELVKAAGGQILARQPKPDSDVTQTINTVAYHAEAGSDQSFCTQYIIYEKASKYHPERIRQGKVWFAPSSWLINSITSFRLLPVEE